MDREVSLFGGAAGRVLRGALSLHSLITGLALGFLLFVGNFALIYAGAHMMVAPFTQVVLAFALARFVLNGQYGEWEGSLFSGVGGTWTTVANVAVRYLLLTLIWLLPMMLVALRAESGVMSPGMLGPELPVLPSLFFMVSALSPPLLLIAAVTAHDFGELFSLAHWQRIFAGRLEDLLSIYAMYTGGVAVAFVLCFPVISLGFQPDWKLGVSVLALAGCFMLGLCLNLLGRLCGFYALGDFTYPVESDASPAILPDPGFAPTVGGAEPRTDTTAPSPPAADREPIQVSQVRTNRSPGAAAQAVSPSPGTDPAVPPTEATPGAATPVLPALLDASQRIDPILNRFQQDPAGALVALEDLNQSFAPHPQVLVALCLCRHRNGEVERAVQLAQTVVPICFERGHVQLAAQVFKQLRREVEQLGLNREQILIVGEALLKKKDLAGAGAAYSIAIGRDPGETRAVKGLLQIAETYVNERARPDAALKVYDYLLKHCADSPLSEFMRDGRANCHKLQQQPVG